jgi:protein-S-isoprenylcysteine O-methyltransferase Ste14
LIFEKTLVTLAAAAAIAAAAGVAVVAAAFALFAVLVPVTGTAGAAAIVAATAAFVVALAGLVAAARAKDTRRRQNDFAAQSAADPSLIVKLFELAKQHPFVAAGAAAAAGIFALRNPALVAAVIKAFFDAPSGPAPPRSR